MEAGLILRKLYAKEGVSDLEYIKWLQDIGLLAKGYFTQKQIKKELGVVYHTVVDWFNFCRELCFEVAINMSEQIGGPGEIVEVDESCFSERKYNRGRKRVSQQWVFGGIQRGTSKCFLVWVEKRDANT
ncbi:hypothetical protein KUF71_024909 [Frankliniella fusca]|uniref:Uncharacterized protein n=1 Tax=Frankliniella fusca TaxID=407009 RepID=A0AAE1LUN0_9NEOP|nr:hypothetical protein KUF71_024909 [Frankliniella fusca]